MANKKVFAVYDDKVGAYMAPFFLQSQGQAIRSFTDAAKDPNTDFCRHPGDFTLFELAEYDELTGKFTNLHAPHSLGTALQAKALGSPELRDVSSERASQ